jgi:hypothetical protein
MDRVATGFPLLSLAADYTAEISKSLCLSLKGSSMTLHAPNIALFVIAFCLAMLGVLAALPIALPIPGLTGNSAWCIFLAWFLLAAGSVVPRSSASK